MLPGQLLPVTELSSYVSSAITKTPASQDKRHSFTLVFNLPFHYLRSFLLLLLLILAEQPVEYVYSSLLFTRRNTKPPIKYQFTFKWCFQPDTLATVKLRTRGQLVLPLNKLWRVVDGFNGVCFLSVPERIFVLSSWILNLYMLFAIFVGCCLFLKWFCFF